MFIIGRMLILKIFKNAWRILMKFLCIYLDEEGVMH